MLRDLVGRPVVRLRLVDAGDLYVNWVWQHQPQKPRTTVIPRHLVVPVLERLRLAQPTPLQGESGLEALTRALAGGALLDLDAESALAMELTASIVPAWLGLELNALEAAGLRPHVRVQPSPSTAHVPWELIGTDGRRRGVDMFDVSVLLPASLRNDPERTVSPWRSGAPIVAVLDPEIPGAAPGGELGSVLGPVAEGSPLTRMVDGWGSRMRPGAAPRRGGDASHARREAAPTGRAPDAFRRRDLGRRALAAMLAGAAAGPAGVAGSVTGSAATPVGGPAANSAENTPELSDSGAPGAGDAIYASAASGAPQSVNQPGRLLYVGHVTSSSHALDARLHLSDTSRAPGHVEPIGPHRPLSAADIALGWDAGEPDRAHIPASNAEPGSASAPMRAPNRVALIACDSGGDSRFAEPTGLVAAFTHRGAEFVTATRWTLPTEEGLRRLASSLGDRAEGMLAEAIVAVDAAHESPDPIAALSAWQCEQRERWTSTGDPRFSPIIWGALATAWSPAPNVP